jgi:choline kinase
VVFIKTVRSPKRTYHYFVESYREEGQIKHRTLRRLTDDEIENPDDALVNFKKELQEQRATTVSKAIILAAGKSSRLYPLTVDIPAGLISLNGQTIIDYLLITFKQGGVNNFCVVGGFNLAKLKKSLPSTIKVYFNPFYQTCRSLASLYFALEEFSEALFISYGDLLFSRATLDKLANSHDDIVIAVSSQSLDLEADKIILREGRLVSISKETLPENSQGVFVGLAMVSAKGAEIIREIIPQIIQEDGFRDYDLPVLFERLSQAGYPITVVDIGEDPWIDIDYPHEVEIAREEILPRIKEYQSRIDV